MVSVFVVLVLAGVAVLVLGRVLLTERVTRARLSRFAVRQRLEITERSGSRVLTYLAVTRRWRRAGLLVALVAAAYWQWWADRRIELNVLAVFAGWFAGVVIAEWRLDTLSRGSERRAATLRRRRVGDYVDRRLLILPGLAWAVVGVVIGVGAVRTAGGDVDQDARFVALAAVAVVVAVALVLVTRRVVTRAQPAVEADLVAADDALRSRSLRVLVGSALAMAGYLGAALYDAITYRLDIGQGDGHYLVGLVGVVVLPVLGVVVAYAPRRTRSQVAAAVPG